MQTYKLACHSFMDAGRTHKASGSETEDFFSHSNSSSKSMGFFLCWFPDPQFPKAVQRGPHGKTHHKRGIQSLGNQILNDRQQARLYFAVRKTLSYKDSQEQRAVSDCSQACRNMTDPWRTVSQQLLST